MINPLFFDNIIKNKNHEFYLPQNLPLNFLHFLLFERNMDSVVLTLHSTCVLYRVRFGISDQVLNSSITNSKLFDSCLEKYINCLLQERDSRLKYNRSIEFTIDHIFLS